MRFYPKMRLWTALILIDVVSALPQAGGAEQLQDCGDARYYESAYTCYNGSFLCPVVNGTKSLRCGANCYLPTMYSCQNDRLVYPPENSEDSCDINQFQIIEEPYENYFYSDCHTSAQVVITSPVNGSNLTVIGPRMVVAWPAGNSGIVAFWAPENGVNGSLTIGLENGTSATSGTLNGVYAETGDGEAPVVGVSGLIRFSSSAVLSVAVLGSIRTIRDFTEGPSILYPQIQNATQFSLDDNGMLSLERLWLDNVTTTTLSFAPAGEGSIALSGNVSTFEAGLYNFSASFNYPQLEQLSPEEVLEPGSQDLITQFPDQTSSLSFFSEKTKLLAGGWRFLTYFGRDSMLTLLLMQPVLSEGEGGAVEAVISAVLERINRTDGSACHEETIGDYATFLNAQKNITSTQAQCDYKMIDTDFLVPVIIKNYFLDTETGIGRADAFFNTTATADFGNGDLTYAELALVNAEKIMNTTAAFAGEGGQIPENLIHLKEGEIVGEWRDSTYGIGGGRIPYNVNTGMVPAALRAISALSANGYFTEHPDWNETAGSYAQVWEDETLRLFEVSLSASEANELVNEYINDANYVGPSQIENITTDVVYHGLALDGNNNQSLIEVLNSDDCFRHFLVNSTNQTQLSNFLSQTADHLLAPFPVGLSTSVGMLIANPAYGEDPIYARNWTNNAYHGTVVWSWQQAMMAAGLERQLDRCNNGMPPDFCSDTQLHDKIRQAYNHLWDLINANSEQLSKELWTWTYQNDDYVFSELGDLPPPPGVGYTESNARQLWSLTFLAVKQNENLG